VWENEFEQLGPCRVAASKGKTGKETVDTLTCSKEKEGGEERGEKKGGGPVKKKDDPERGN